MGLAAEVEGSPLREGQCIFPAERKRAEYVAAKKLAQKRCTTVVLVSAGAATVLWPLDASEESRSEIIEQQKGRHVRCFHPVVE